MVEPAVVTLEQFAAIDADTETQVARALVLLLFPEQRAPVCFGCGKIMTWKRALVGNHRPEPTRFRCECGAGYNLRTGLFARKSHLVRAVGMARAWLAGVYNVSDMVQLAGGVRGGHVAWWPLALQQAQARGDIIDRVDWRRRIERKRSWLRATPREKQLENAARAREALARRRLTQKEHVMSDDDNYFSPRIARERFDAILESMSERTQTMPDGSVVLTGPNQGPLSDAMQQAVKNQGGTITNDGHGMLPLVARRGLTPEERAAIERFSGDVRQLPLRKRGGARAGAGRPKGSRKSPKPSERILQSRALVEEALEYVFQTGLSVEEACDKTGASYGMAKRRLYELKAEGADLGLYSYQPKMKKRE